MADDDEDGSSETRGPEEATRDLRRSLYLSTAVDLAIANVLSAFDEPDRERALYGVLHHQLGRAFDEGCVREYDLKSAVNTLRAQVDILKKSNRELLRRISKDR
jgi:hypothetical protein